MKLGKLPLRGLCPSVGSAGDAGGPRAGIGVQPERLCRNNSRLCPVVAGAVLAGGSPAAKPVPGSSWEAEGGRDTTRTGARTQNGALTSAASAPPGNSQAEGRRPRRHGPLPPRCPEVLGLKAPVCWSPRGERYCHQTAMPPGRGKGWARRRHGDRSCALRAEGTARPCVRGWLEPERGGGAG